jgi:hypothetical protein
MKTPLQETRLVREQEDIAMPKPRITPIFSLNDAAKSQLAHDGVQWILQRRTLKHPVPGGHNAFESLAFVRGSKLVLLRCIRERDETLGVDELGRRRLLALPDTFNEFLRLSGLLGSGELLNRIVDAADVLAPLPSILVRRRRGLSPPRLPLKAAECRKSYWP